MTDTITPPLLPVHDFQVGDRVFDKNAAADGWPDAYGEVVAIQGPFAKVRYRSGFERWKLHVNLKRDETHQ